MKIAFFSTKKYDVRFFSEANIDKAHDIEFLESPLNEETVGLAKGYQAVCVFVNDVLNKTVVEKLGEYGIELIALRCAGFNNVDLDAAEKAGIKVVRVPAYSPYSVAEHTVGLILTLNRKFHKAYSRVREANFSLEGLLGFDLNGKTIGVIGAGKIGALVCKIMTGFGCRVLAYDAWKNPECLKIGVEFVELKDLVRNSDIVSLHCPLMPETWHLFDGRMIGKMKNGAMLINTSRGGLVDTLAVIDALKCGKISALGLDVYEEEADLFFEDLSGEIIKDDVFSRLLTFPNVVITGHQAFFTREALSGIAKTTIENLKEFQKGVPLQNEVVKEKIIPKT